MLRIRKMAERDLDQVAAIAAAVFSEPWSRQGFAETLPMENVCFLVAKEEETVLGYAGLSLAADEGEIINVAVSPAFRRRGNFFHREGEKCQDVCYNSRNDQ